MPMQPQQHALRPAALRRAPLKLSAGFLAASLAISLVPVSAHAEAHNAAPEIPSIADQAGYGYGLMLLHEAELIIASLRVAAGGGKSLYYGQPIRAELLEDPAIRKMLELESAVPSV